jgi:hypothetical protein
MRLEAHIGIDPGRHEMNLKHIRARTRRQKFYNKDCSVMAVIFRTPGAPAGRRRGRPPLRQKLRYATAERRRIEALAQAKGRAREAYRAVACWIEAVGSNWADFSARGDMVATIAYTTLLRFARRANTCLLSIC